MFKFFRKLLKVLQLNGWVKAILCFCVIGLLCNLVLVGRDIAHDGILLRLHLGFLILYAGQVVFIWLQERLVWMLAVLQGIMALLTNADFTFMPLLRVLGGLVFAFNTDPSIEFTKVYQYVIISLAFTLQMLSAFALFSLLPKPRARKPKETQVAK